MKYKDLEITGYCWQPTGFGQAVLEDKTKINLWRPEWAKAGWINHIHSHKFWFESKVLYGQMEYREYRVNHKPQAHMAEWVFNHKAVELIFVRYWEIPAGTDYVLGGSDRFHEIMCMTETMTHFRQVPMIDKEDSGFVRPIVENRLEIEQEQPRKGEIQEHIHRILRTLESKNGK